MRIKIHSLYKSRVQLPVAECIASNGGVRIVKTIIAHGAPNTIIANLQATFTSSVISDKTKSCTKQLQKRFSKGVQYYI